MTSEWEQQIKAQIKRRYAGLESSAEDGAAKAVAHGYPAELISELPPALAAGYSGCGYLFEGLDFKGDETVVDLGSGAGLDSYIATLQLTNGTVISIDMTIEMLEKVNLRLSINYLCADIEALPLKDSCADLVIANASFNLAISKTKAFAEAYRVLKSGGRLVARDLVKEGELPAEVLTDPLSFNTSLGGALEEDALIAEIAKAGFEDITLSDHKEFSYVQSVKIQAIRA
tara:strand:+ start:3990 stop:4679 length:690 start_codon:yes stop_codon:yes gene_type:complete